MVQCDSARPPILDSGRGYRLPNLAAIQPYLILPPFHHLLYLERKSAMLVLADLTIILLAVPATATHSM